MRIEQVFRVGAAVGIVLALNAGDALADEAGEAGYGKHCAACHGLGGEGDTAAGKAMKVKSLKGLGLDAAQLAARIRDSARHDAVTSKLNDDELAAIVRFVSNL